MLQPDFVFRLANGAALLAWIALLCSPPEARWSAAVRRVTGRVVPLLFCLLYVVMLLAYLPRQGGFGTLAEVRILFDIPGLLAAGWIHYLAFDLFVGSWIAARGAALRLPQWQLVPVLLLTFLFGPAGLLAFMLLRAVRRPASLLGAAQDGAA